MSLVANIIRNKIDDSENFNKTNQYQSVLLRRTYSFFGIVLLLFATIMGLVEGKTWLVVIHLIPILLLLQNLTKYTRNFVYAGRAENLILLSYFISSLYFIYSLGEVTNNFLWLYIFPVITLSLKGKKTGNFLSLSYLVFVLIIILTGKFIYAAYTDLTFTHLIRITGFYFVFHGLYLVFEEFKVLNQSSFEEQINKFRSDNRSKDEFISKLSHQIRTPLNNIMVISNLVKETSLDTKQKDLIETIMASTTTLVNVVNNIVKVTNVEFTATTSRETTFNLIPTIKSSLSILEEQHEKKSSIAFNTDKNLQDDFYTGDPIRIKQIFLNIIENIYDHGYQKPHISISVFLSPIQSDEYSTTLKTEISCNTSMLFSKEDLSANNLQVVVHTHDSKTIIEEIPKADFTIAKKILELNKSRLFIESDKQSTRFSFTITFQKPVQKDAKKHKLESVVPKPSHVVKVEDANVLLVEDNLINQKIVILSLKKAVKNIDVANNGKEALDKFGTSRYDIILMDVQMPVMDGMVTTRKIRELELSSNTQTPIIAITANALAGDKESCLAAGMNDYISKPFQIEVLLQKMKKMLE